MNLVIDVGNTHCKVALFDDKIEPFFVAVHDSLDKNLIEDIVVKYNPQHALLCTVVDVDSEIIAFLYNRMSHFMVFNNDTSVCLENKYSSPETLGKDRMAAAVGAWCFKPNRTLLIIDAGTAITYDIVNNKGQYLGGNISPGLRIRFRSLHNFTSHLPVVVPREDFEFFGKDTESAIRSGVMQGLLFEIKSYISKEFEKFDDLEVFFTGGDYFYFVNKLKNRTFVSPNLVLIGLNRILKDNVKYKK